MKTFVDENVAARLRRSERKREKRRYEREHAAHKTRFKNRTWTFGMSMFHCLRSFCITLLLTTFYHFG